MGISKTSQTVLRFFFFFFFVLKFCGNQLIWAPIIFVNSSVNTKLIVRAVVRTILNSILM